MGNELVERRVHQADNDGKAIHGAEDADEIAALEWEEPCERFLTLLRVVGDDHFLNGALALDALFRLLKILEEHVLGANEADAFRTHFAGLARVLGGVGIGADAQGADLVAPGEKGFVGGRELGVGELELALIDGSLAAIEGDPVALADDAAAGAELFLGVIDVEGFAADDAALAPSAGD